jgi:molybdate transport system substrate-binding protein
MVRRARALSAVLMMLGCVGCGPPDGAPRLAVYAASSLTEAFAELATVFEQRSGMPVDLSLGASSMLAMQVIHGAPADVLASADAEQMDRLVQLGLANRSDIVQLCRNRLALVVPSSNPAGVHDLSDLARPGVRLVVAPPDVPLGRYTRQLLARAAEEFGSDYQRSVVSNFISQEPNSRQVLARVELGEVDAAFVYASDMRAARNVQAVSMPGVTVEAAYYIAVLAPSRHRLLAREFVTYVMSEDGQATLRRWGFTVDE